MFYDYRLQVVLKSLRLDLARRICDFTNSYLNFKYYYIKWLSDEVFALINVNALGFEKI